MVTGSSIGMSLSYSDTCVTDSSASCLRLMLLSLLGSLCQSSRSCCQIRR